MRSVVVAAYGRPVVALGFTGAVRAARVVPLTAAKTARQKPSVPTVMSTTPASAAFFCTDSTPLRALALVLYPWLAAMISPLPALRWNLYSPLLSLMISNLSAMPAARSPKF